jgi:ATP-binding cassette, subfamily C, bacterial CydC
VSALWSVWRLLWRARRITMALGAALVLTVLLAGAGLLALSGWFITATGAAGLAGAGAVFNVFGPSAGIRALALGRTFGRYGERLLTHDATLGALTALRVDLLRRQTRAGLDAMLRLRGAVALNRLTADVDALDSVALRLALPLLGAIVTQSVVFAALWAWVGLPVSLWVIGTFVGGGALVLTLTARTARAPSIAAERATQGLRQAVIDLVRGRVELIVYGRMGAQTAIVLAADVTARRALRQQDRIDRAAALALSLIATLAGAGAMVIGSTLIANHRTTPALAGLAVFAALALAETLHALRRGMADLGRMRDAADRVMAPAEPPLAQLSPHIPQGGPGLTVSALSYRRAGASRAIFTDRSLTVAPGETVAVAAPSGAGKSTLLFVIAGLLPPDTGSAFIDGTAISAMTEPDLRAHLTLLPQRTALVAGSIRDNLALGRDALTDADAWAALQAAALADVIQGKGGLDARLGEAGAGLSGGEARRLALARALLRRARVLLLDEPTEGLDPETAARTLHGIRTYLPDAAILTTSHRSAELGWADRVILFT